MRYVAHIILRKAVDEEGQVTFSIQNNRPVSSGFSLIGASHPLLDDSTASISVGL